MKYFLLMGFCCVSIISLADNVCHGEMTVIFTSKQSDRAKRVTQYFEWKADSEKFEQFTIVDNVHFRVSQSSVGGHEYAALTLTSQGKQKWQSVVSLSEKCPQWTRLIHYGDDALLGSFSVHIVLQKP